MESKDIENILTLAVKNVYARYPDVEWDDLVCQGWLIVTEKINGYDKSKGSSLSTYLYNNISYGLQDYIRRNVLKELNMNGHRDHGDYLEAVQEGDSERLIARMTYEKMVASEQGVSRDILLLMAQDISQAEVARRLGVSKQYVTQVLQKLREKYKD